MAAKQIKAYGAEERADGRAVMDVKVSVIIPVYNVEKYIEECLDSLLEQTLREIEIICVDDGSTDGTMEILRRYEENDSRIKVIQQKNQYAGVARNNGMQYASGKYMLFLDSDDFFHGAMLEKAYTEAERTEAEVVLFGGQSFDDVSKEINPMPWLLNTKILPERLPFNRKSSKGLLLNGTSPAPWNKLFQSEFVKKHQLQFQALQNSNDVFFTFSAISLADRISYVNEALVYYRRGMETSLQGGKKKAPLCFLEAYNCAYHKMQEAGVYEEVKAGFRGTVISGCLYNFDSHHDCATKKVLLDAFVSEKFQEMNLFGGEPEEYANYKNVERLKKLIEAYELKNVLPGDSFESEMQPEISVVLSVGEDAKQLEKCINSLLNQEFQDFEIICVDCKAAGTPWSDAYRLYLEDDRVKMCGHNAETLGEARSLGLQAARGNYILFLEPDNVLDSKAFSNVLKAADPEAQMVLLAGYTYKGRLEEAKPLPKCIIKKKFVKKKAYRPAKDTVILSRTSMEFWTKLFRKDLLEASNLTTKDYLQEEKKIGMLALSSAEKVCIADQAQIFMKDQSKKKNLTEQEIRVFFDLYYEIYEELQQRQLFEQVQKGFRNSVLADGVFAFNKISTHTAKIAFARELSTDDFARLGITLSEGFDTEGMIEKKYTDQYECLLGLKKGALWKNHMDKVQKQKEFRVLQQAEHFVTPKISVIVPCYNIEKYVGECIESLMNQTLKEIEIICVNDGSVDRTKEILLEYGKKDARITIIDQENGGLSVGRNVGVKNANGEYICFVDSDDFLELYALEELYEKASKEQLDLLFYDGDSVFETENIKERRSNYIDYYVRQHDYRGVYKGLDLLCEFRKHNEYRQSACMQLIRRAFFLEQELWFHPGIYHEDNAFTFKGLLHAERAAHVNRVYYLRRVIENSIMTSKKRFAHSYGYFTSFVDMWEIARGFEFSSEEEEIISAMLRQVLHNARNIYRELEIDEQYFFECLSPMEYNMFFMLVVQLEREQTKLKALQEAKAADMEKAESELNKLKSSKSYRWTKRVGKVAKKVRKIFG